MEGRLLLVFLVQCTLMLIDKWAWSAQWWDISELASLDTQPALHPVVSLLMQVSSSLPKQPQHTCPQRILVERAAKVVEALRKLQDAI